MKISTVLCLFLGLSAGLSALSLDDVLPGLSPKDKAELTAEKEVVFYSESAPDFRFLPKSPLSEKIKTLFAGYSPTVTDEALFLLPLPPGETDRSLYIYNKIRAISTLSGITYRSSRHKETRVLFSDVYAVDSLRSKKKVPDKTLSRLPESEKFPVHIEDANFGSEYYEATYLTSGDTLAFGLKNLTSLKYIFPVIGAENVRFQILAIPLDEGLLVYGVCAVEASDFIKNLIHLPSAFYKRMETLKDWFSSQIY